MSTFVIRPGETDYDAQNRVQGALNLPLNSNGVEEAQLIARALRDSDLDVIYCSPTEPAPTTARYIAQELDLPVKVVDQLENLDLGLWEGLPVSEIRDKQPRVFRQWEDVPESICPPHGESADEAVVRVKKSLKKLIRKGGAYAIVAPEPLATLVSSVLQGECARLRGPCCRVQTLSKIERIEEKQPVASGDSWSWTRQ